MFPQKLLLLGKGGGLNSGCCRKRNAGGVLSVILPGAAWLALPKCPVCFAGYLALFTGLGVSAGFAGLRVVLIFLTFAALFLFAVRLFRNYKFTKP